MLMLKMTEQRLISARTGKNQLCDTLCHMLTETAETNFEPSVSATVLTNIVWQPKFAVVA